MSSFGRLSVRFACRRGFLKGSIGAAVVLLFARGNPVAIPGAYGPMARVADSSSLAYLASILDDLEKSRAAGIRRSAWQKNEAAAALVSGRHDERATLTVIEAEYRMATLQSVGGWLLTPTEIALLGYFAKQEGDHDPRS